MKKARQYLAATLIAAMTAGMMSVPSIAAPDEKGNGSGPEYKTVKMYDGKANKWADYPVFFANGVPVTVDAPTASDSNIGAVITWDGGRAEVANNTQVFAGGGLDTDYSEGSIIMNGGQVGALNGGGYGVTEGSSSENPKYDTTKTANVRETYIEMRGGKVTQILGGGHGYSTVDDATILMTGGSVGAISGGGISSLSGLNDTSTLENCKNSPCHVKNVTMTVSGGEIKDYPRWAGDGLISGGGQGYNATDNVTINITGNIKLDHCWMMAGGQNGYAGNATVNMSGGSLMSFQSLNRGVIDSVEVNVSGGKIKDLYAAGDSSASNVVGTLGHANINIIRGEVTNLHMGNTVTTQVELLPDNDVVTARYGRNAEIGNLEAAKTAFGTCLTALLTDVTISKETLSMAIGQKEKLEAKVTGGVATGSEIDGIIWSSDNEDVATVDGDGKVTAEAAGTAVIKAAYAKDDAIFATCTVTVKQPELKLSSKSSTIKVGGELELTAVASPSEAAIGWTIEDESILEDITEHGEDSDTIVVKGIGVGETTVTAYLEDFENVKAVCKITVKENPNLPVDEQVESIVNGLDSALNGGPGSSGTPLTPEEKTTLADNAVKAVANVVTPTAIGKLKDPEAVANVYDNIILLEDTLQNNFNVESEIPDDSNVSIALMDVAGLLANVDIAEAGGTLPEAGGTETVTVSLGLEPAEVPAEAASQVNVDSAVAVDIKLLQQKSGAAQKAIQPRIPILFTIEAPDGVDLTKPVKVWNYHNGNAKTLKSWVDVDTEEISFLADQFSVFVIGNVKETAPTTPKRGGSGGKSTGWHPQGTWIQNELGWKFKNYDGTYAADCWKQLTYNGREDWYHFDGNGFMQTGWFTDKDGQIYYLNPIPDGYRGAMFTGWQLIEGKYYYFNPVSDGSRGSLYRSRTTPDGHTVGADGSRIQ